MKSNIIDLVTKYPLFNSINKDALNIYVFGDNTEFVDVALQLGQIEGINLIVHWQCSELLKDTYLKNRPSLYKFISINEISNDLFGSLSFENINDIEKNGYCVTDALNKDKLGNINNTKYRFIISDKITSLDNIKEDDFFSDKKEIERMAYNLNTIWYGKAKYNNVLLQKEFKDEYNYKSSMICAISIEYKLVMANILDNNYDIAKNEFLKLKENQEEYEKLVYKLAEYEHRRWCIEKIVDGWNPLTEINDLSSYSYFVINKTLKNKELKIHPAIAKSSDNKGLIGIDNWDKVDPNQLDDLDKVSFNLNKIMKEESKTIDIERIYNYLANLSEMIKVELYSRYELIIQNIIDGIDIDIEKLDDISLKIANEYEYNFDIKNYVKEINDELFSKIEANKYRNYKKNDIDIIDNIPYILSYRPNLNVGNFIYKITNRYEDSNNYFSDVASIISIYPKKVCSIMLIDNDIDSKYVIHRLNSLKEFYDVRNLGLKTKYLLLFDNCDMMERMKNNLKGLFIGLSFEIYDNHKDCNNIIINYFKDNGIDIIDTTYLPYDSSNKNLSLINIIKDNNISYYEFDNKNQEFIETVNCDYLKLVRKDNYLTVDELFALNSAKSRIINNPNFISDYKFYFDIVTGKSTNNKSFTNASLVWNDFCKIARNIEGFGESSFKNDKELMKIVNYLLDKSKIEYKNGLYYFIKEEDRVLLEKNGDILEFFVFYELLKSNYFSDVKTGFKFNWNSEIDNELDAVVTCGYKSVLIECKITNEMDQTFYLKLDSIADHFGVNYHPIIIAISKSLSNENVYIKRGEQLDIITISSLDDLNNLAKRIKSIFNK